MNKLKINENIEKILFFLVCLYFIDIIVFGTGTITRIGFFSSRIIIGIMAVMFSLPIVVKKIRNKYIIMIMAFLVILFIGLVRGIISNNSYGIMKSDISGFAHILITLPMMCCLNSERRVIKLIKVISHTLSVFATITLILTFSNIFPKSIADNIRVFLDAQGLGGVTVLTGNAVRIFLHTPSRLFMVAFVFYLIMCMKKNNGNKMNICAMSINLAAAFVSYTRSLYLGILVAFCIAVILVLSYFKEEMLKLFSYLGCSIVLTVVLLIALSLAQQTNLFSVAIDRCLMAEGFGDSEIDGTNQRDENEKNSDRIEMEMLSVSIRNQRQELALENIRRNPILGCGLGVVNDAKGEHIELFYLDILSKIGIIGLFVFLSPFVCAVYDYYTKRYSRLQRLVLLAGIVSVTYAMFFSYFNPFMNSAIGLSLYGLCISQTFVWEKDN